MTNIREMINRLDEIGPPVNPEQLADDALNEAVRLIQDKLGQEHGDFAGMFFSGKAENIIKQIFVQYIKEEMANMEQ